MNRYLVYIKSDYIRDAQAFIGKIEDHDSDPLEEEFGWRDINAPMLVIDRSFDSIEEIHELLRTHYPEADPSIFRIFRVQNYEEVFVS